MRPVENVSTERTGRVAVVRFSSAPDGCIGNKGAALLDQAISAALADPEVGAIVLTGGEADIFIRHADVGQIVRATEALRNGIIQPDSFLDTPFARLSRLLDGAEKPVIAAINGICLGGGFEIALSCTMRIAAEDVVAIGLPEIRIGIFPGGGGTQRLPRIIGGHRARLFILRGDAVDAHEALAIGLVDEVVPDALSRAVAVAEQLSKRGSMAIAAVMRLMRLDQSCDRIELELTSFAELLRKDPAALEQMRSFLDAQEALHELS